MNLKSLLLGGASLTLAVGISLTTLTGCGSKRAQFSGDQEPTEASLTYLKEVHAPEASDLATDSLLLYVDYSTCVAEAMNSKFFQEVQPTIVSNHPIYFSIKGDKIARENGDTYTLLRGVKEVNNADLKTAAEQIAAQNRQAVLITDAEYWHPGVGDNLNNPYMKEAVSKWLASGRDIYIYAEPYLESGKFNKKRYYILFTDDRLDPETNINSKMQKAISSLGDVKKLHLSARAPKAVVEEVPVDDNDGLMLYDKGATRENFRAGVPMLVFESSLSDIATSLKGAGENKKGDPINLPFISGIQIPVDAEGIFSIDDFDVKVYDLTEQAIEFTTPEEDEEGNPVKKTATLELSPMDDVLEIGEKEIENGQFALYFKDDFTDAGSVEGPMLLRIDIVADDAKTNFDKEAPLYEVLSWDSISKAAQGGRNNSFFESVKQAVINDKTIDPTAKGRNVVYTLYVFTN